MHVHVTLNILAVRISIMNVPIHKHLHRNVKWKIMLCKILNNFLVKIRQLYICADARNIIFANPLGIYNVIKMWFLTLDTHLDVHSVTVLECHYMS